MAQTPANNPGMRRTNKWRPALLAISLMLGMPLSLSALIYMDIPGIPGESKAPGYEGWIELQDVRSSLDVGIYLDIVSKPWFRDLIVSKATDKSSPKLFESCLTGRSIGSARIKINRQIQGAYEEWFELQMTDAYLTQFTTEGSAGNNSGFDYLYFNFASLKWSYRQLDMNGFELYRANTYWDIGMATGGFDEAEVNGATPVIEPVKQQLVMPGQVYSVQIRVSDADTPVESLEVSAGTGQPDILKKVRVSGSGEFRTVDFETSALLSSTSSITVTVSDGVRSSSTSFAVVFGVELTPFEAFLAAYYNEEELATLSIIGDDDGDSIPTLVEYYLGSNPREFNYPSDVLRIDIKPTPEGRVVILNYMRRTNEKGVGPIRWMSPESLLFEPLVPGGENPLYEESTSGTSNPLYESVTGTMPIPPGMDESALLFRFEASL